MSGQRGQTRRGSARHLARKEAFPAGVPGLADRMVPLPSGLRVRVVEAGAPDAPPVVLVPGWGCSAYLFRRNLAPLATAGYRASAFDLKGQGWSDKPDRSGEYTSSALAAHVLEVLDVLHPYETVRLVGVSLGGAVAARAAMEAPDRVRQLVLCDAVGLGRVHLVEAVQRVLLIAGRLVPARATRRMVELALRSSYANPSLPTPRDVDEYFAPARDPAFARAQIATLREMDWGVMAPAELARLTMPVLVLFGTRDGVVSPSGVEDLVRRMPDGRMGWIEGAGHIAVEEAPDAVNRALIEFFRGGGRG